MRFSDISGGLCLPESLTYLTTYLWRPVTLGRSSGRVYRLESPTQTRFLKTVDSEHASELRNEAERLIWLQSKVPVPKVLHYLEDAAGAFLVTSAVGGRDLTTFNRETVAVKRGLTVAFAHGLRQVHALGVTPCPFDHTPARHLVLLEAALNNRVSVSLRGEKLSPRHAFETLLAERPTGEDLVVTHGDPCLPNVLIERGKLSGFIDVGSAGVGDRYRDLALARWSLNYNFGEGFADLFFSTYGLDEPDEAKLAFHHALEHLLYG